MSRLQCGQTQHIPLASLLAVWCRAGSMRSHFTRNSKLVQRLLKSANYNLTMHMLYVKEKTREHHRQLTSKHSDFFAKMYNKVSCSKVAVCQCKKNIVRGSTISSALTPRANYMWK